LELGSSCAIASENRNGRYLRIPVETVEVAFVGAFTRAALKRGDDNITALAAWERTNIRIILNYGTTAASLVKIGPIRHS
jgi:hypothetical protein